MITIRNILVPTDFSEASDAALTYGRELASRYGATLHLLHVADNLQLSGFAEAYGSMASAVQADIEAAARTRLDELLIDSDGSGPASKSALVASIAPAFAIVDYAEREPIDLIVIGTHGRGGLSRVLLGSVAERVVRMAPCPVLTVRQREREFVRPDTLVAVSRA